MYFNAKDFNYNIEDLLGDYYKYINESKSYKLENRGGLVYADKISVNADAYEDERAADMRKTDDENEIELMRALYTEINQKLLPYVRAVLAEYGYSGSPVYAPDGITREFMAQIVDQVIERAARDNDDPYEVISEERENGGVFTPWSRWMLMRAVTEAAVLNEIFRLRRSARA